MKYTDEQIKKALDSADLFLRNRANAEPAPLNEYDKEELLDIAKICCNALDLINRQESEIDHLREATKKVTSEAIKEFAERLKEKASPYPYYQYGLIDAVSVEDIDNLAKEMVGESE